MSLDFPTGPVIGQIYTAEGTTWVFDGGAWLVAQTQTTVIPPLNTVRDLLTNTTIGYVFGGSTTVVVRPGDVIAAGGFRYLVLPLGGVPSVTNANPDSPVLLRALPDASGVVSMLQTGAVGDGAADDTAAYVAASAACGDGGTISFPARTYLIDYAAVQANRKHDGDGWQSVVKPLTTETRAALTADSGSASAFVNNVSFRNLHFKSMDAPTFSEQKHLVTLNGCSNWTFENCKFTGWRGDAVYIGSSDLGGTNERHNRNIRILNCDFDGVNNENRQAISVIDVDGLWITGNTFRNCTKSTMPGVIDLEPNSNAFHIIRNAWIQDNTFTNCGGNVATVAVLIPAVVPLATNINVIGNTSTGATLSAAGGFVGVITNRAPTATDVDMKISVERNYVRNTVGGSFLFLGAKGVRSKGNVFTDHTAAGYVGFTGAAQFCRDISISDTFIRCGSTVGSGLDVFSVDRLDLTGSTFIDCGNGVGAASAINFKSGASSNVKLNDITITSPTGKTLRAVLTDVGHSYSALTNENFNCQWGALFNAFAAANTDVLWVAYAPVVEGASSPGAGSYSRQYGRWRRIGKQVFFELEIVQSSHSGTGLIEISLPVQVQSSSNNELRPVAIALDGAATSGGQIGLINPAATAGGVIGAIHCYHTGTGSLQQTTVPAGAAIYRASGTYMSA